MSASVEIWVWKCLKKPSNGAGNVLTIRTEAGRCHRALEGEVVEEDSAAPVNEKGAAVFINRQQQATVRAEAQCPDLL